MTPDRRLLPGQDRAAIRRWYNGYNWSFEFKVTDEPGAGKALQQLIDQNYADKYRAPDVTITLIGIAFSPSERNVVGFETLTLDTAA